MATVLLHPDVQKSIASLPNDIEDRIRSKLAEAGTSPERHLKPLTGRDEYSLRIGKRRAIIDWDQHEDELRVLEIDTRDTVYQSGIKPSVVILLRDVIEKMEKWTRSEITESRHTGGGKSEGSYRTHRLLHDPDVVMSTCIEPADDQRTVLDTLSNSTI